MEKTFLKKKRNNFHFNKRPNYSKPISRQLEPIEIRYQLARDLYEANAKKDDLDKIDLTLRHNKDKNWTQHILTTGTFEDKISSLVLYIRSSPQTTLKYIEMLIQMAENKNRRKNESVIMALKELFLETLLQNKKFLPFNLRFKNDDTVEPSNEELLEAYYDDKIHHLYARIVNLLIDRVRNDPLTQMKKRYMDVLYEMLIKQPEAEEKILTSLIDKLGDPQSEVVNHALTLLKNLQNEHMMMSMVIFTNVKRFFIQSQVGHNGKLYSLIYLTQMNIPHKGLTDFIEQSLSLLFDQFNQFTIDSNVIPTPINIISPSDDKENAVKENKKDKFKGKEDIKLKGKDKDNSISNNATIEQYLTLIVKRINSLFKYIKQNKVSNEQVNTLIKEKILLLFKLSHNKSLKLSIEILRLLFGILQTQDESFGDRYYKTLYALLDKTDITQSKHIKEVLKLLMLSIIYDTNNTRVASFIKRLLSMSLISEPPFIICVLIMISQIIRNKNKLWKLIDKDQKGNLSEYDHNKRDPQYAKGDKSFLNELLLLSQHYHPSVQKMSQFIIANYNKEVITYDGDPLVDFSLVNFLEKFIFKNAKITKEKKKKPQETDEEAELMKFMEEEDEEEYDEEGHKIKKKDNTEAPLGEHDLQFISKFNNVFPQISSSKNYLKKLKKKEKKELETANEGDADADLDMQENDNELDKYANKVMEDEYEKYNKDIDEDVEFDDFFGEDNEGEELEEDNGKGEEMEEDGEFEEVDDN